MVLKTEHRWMILAAALLLTVVAIYFPGQEENGANSIELANPGRPKHVGIKPGMGDATSKPISQMMDLPDLSKKQEDGAPDNGKSADLFLPHAWYVPPPPKPVVQAEAVEAPTVPPLPYVYMGKMDDTPDGELIFLAGNNKVMNVKIGDVIENDWRLESEDARSLQFTYVPLEANVSLLKSTKQVKPIAQVPVEDQGSAE